MKIVEPHYRKGTIFWAQHHPNEDEFLLSCAEKVYGKLSSIFILEVKSWEATSRDYKNRQVLILNLQAEACLSLQCWDKGRSIWRMGHAAPYCDVTACTFTFCCIENRDRTSQDFLYYFCVILVIARSWNTSKMDAPCTCYRHCNIGHLFCSISIHLQKHLQKQRYK